MRTKPLICLLFLSTTFYQLDYRERLSAGVSIFGAVDIKVKKSLETRYRTQKIESYKGKRALKIETKQNLLNKT
jgi:hypothetical protein